MTSSRSSFGPRVFQPMEASRSPVACEYYSNLDHYRSWCCSWMRNLQPTQWWIGEPLACPPWPLADHWCRAPSSILFGLLWFLFWQFYDFHLHFLQLLAPRRAERSFSSWWGRRRCSVCDVVSSCGTSFGLRPPVIFGYPGPVNHFVHESTETYYGYLSEHPRTEIVGRQRCPDQSFGVRIQNCHSWMANCQTTVLARH